MNSQFNTALKLKLRVALPTDSFGGIQYNTALKRSNRPEFLVACFGGIQLSPSPPRSPSKNTKQQPITQIKVASSNSLPFLYCFSVSALSTINSAAVYP